ncbi:holo-ACP synthase [Pseudomonadota bacterium]
MILGVGIDLINIERMENVRKEFGEKFNDKIFTEHENKIVEKFSGNKKKIDSYYAKRFALKEAFAKAVGTGIGNGINFKDIEILNDIKGKPYIKLSEKTSKFIEKKFKTEMDKIQIDVSTSDDYPLANAIVVISTN